MVLVALALLTGMTSAHAELVTAMNVTADYYPGNHYSVGLDLDNNNLIHQVYFQDQNGNQTFWTLDELANFQPVFTIAGFQVVEMKIASHVGNTSAVIELQYTTNTLTGSTANLLFQCSLNAATGQYQVVDERTNQVIHNAETTTHYSFLHLPVGVNSIVTN